MTFRIKSFGDQDTREESKSSYKIKSFEEPLPSIGDQLQNSPALFARELESEIKGLPRSVGDLIKYGSEKLQKLGEEQALEQGREIPEGGDPFTNKVVEVLGKPAEYLEKWGLPTKEEAKKTFNKRYKERFDKELPEKGRGKIEKFAEGAGEAGAYAISRNPYVSSGTIIAGGTSKAADLGTGGSIGTNLSVPVILNLAHKIASKKYIPKPGEAQQLYKAGKDLGMTDKQLAPILATEGQITRYGPLAAGKKETKQAFQDTYEVLGTTVDKMQNLPISKKRVGIQKQNRFVKELEKIENDIRTRSPSLSPQEKTHADFIREAINNIQNNGLTPRQAIGLWRSNNRIGLGQTELSRLRDPINKLLEEVSPELARDFKATNRMFQKYYQNLKEINPTAFNAFMDAGEMQKVLGAIFTGDPKSLKKSLYSLGTYAALKKLSSEMIINPKYQSLGRKFKTAVNTENVALQRSLYKELMETVKKENPEEYKEITWPKIS
jgi:hypothetical protein